MERELLASLVNLQDGFLDRYVYRLLSRRLTRLFLHLPLRANHVTLLAVAIGLTASLLFAMGGYVASVLGALLLQGSAVLDCCDGEIARIRFEESQLGYWLDIVGDTLVHLAVFGGITWGAVSTKGTPFLFLVGGVLVAGALLSFALVTYVERGGVLGKGGNGWEARVMELMLRTLTTHDFYLPLFLFALLGILDWFLWGAAVGAHGFWLTLLGLLWRVKKGSAS